MQSALSTFTFNRIGYALFLLLAAYFLVIRQDVGSAVSNAGLALIFDPFDPRTPFQNRPRYQQVWLYVHVAVVVGLFIFMLVQ